ncbi:UNVERIFIED_CONTAM: hypothetical protein PYX00_006149 [Menopon gallinae]|uniref:Ig-like domain-containing protein n=1 Tax=Menopon gallinae TaxID=328185 RepID=A0AAW2HUA7_9NEOP
MFAVFVSICFISIIECSTAQDSFYFSKYPNNTVVANGAPVVLECQVSHQENIIYYWNLNDTRLNNTTRRRQVGSNLHITRTDRLLDSGEYSCIAENVTSGYSLTSKTALLDITCKSNSSFIVVYTH